MDSDAWDRRYASADLIWSAGPNRWVEEVAAELPAGRALDLAAGEGRNALWLAERGWRVTAVDFSAVALRRAGSLAERRLGEHADRIELIQADLREYVPDRRAHDLGRPGLRSMPSSSPAGGKRTWRSSRSRKADGEGRAAAVR